MAAHPKHTEVIEAIKALDAYTNPRNTFESELAECYSDAELVECFGWEDGKPRTPKQAAKAAQELCDNRQDIYGWIAEEGEAERRAAQEDNARYLAELAKANSCGWLVERRPILPEYVPYEDDPTLSDEENERNAAEHAEGFYCLIEGYPDTEIVECGVSRSNIIRNGVVVGWQCEAGHSFVSEEYKTDEERHEDYLADRDDY